MPTQPVVAEFGLGLEPSWTPSGAASPCFCDHSSAARSRAAQASTSTRSNAMPCMPVGMTVTPRVMVEVVLSMPRYFGALRGRMNHGKKSDCDFDGGGIRAADVVQSARRRSCHPMPIMAGGRTNVSWKNRGKFGESAEETCAIETVPFEQLFTNHPRCLRVALSVSCPFRRKACFLFRQGCGGDKDRLVSSYSVDSGVISNSSLLNPVGDDARTRSNGCRRHVQHEDSSATLRQKFK